MEIERRLTSRLKRKALSDCTNLPPSKLVSQTLTKPPLRPPDFTTSKPSNIAQNNRGKQTPYFNSDKNGSDNTSVKSHTSTGSNNSPISDGIPSQPPTPIPYAGDRDARKSGPFAAQIQRQYEQIRKDKGKSVEAASLTKASELLAARAVQISSSIASAQIQRQHTQTRKDKEKSVEVTPLTKVSGLLATQAVQISSSVASDNGGCLPRPPPVENHDVDEQRRKDKGKMIVETPMIDVYVPLTSHPPQTSSSAASGNFCLPGPAAVHSQKLDKQTAMDKEKVVQETPSAEASDPMTPSSLMMPLFTASGTDSPKKGGLIVYTQRRTSQRKKHAVGSITLPLSCPPDKRRKKKGVQRVGSSDGHSGSHTDPLPLHKKKRSRNKSDNSVHAMPDNEVAKLKAYYADIDAFELPEEVASDNELE